MQVRRTSKSASHLLPGRPCGSVRQKYASLMAPHLVGESDVMLFALDNYSAPYACLVGPQPESSAQDELLAWLRFIGIQCPE